MNRSKVGYADNIESESLENSAFRKVLYTGGHMQLVVMTLLPGEEIGAEVHEGHDQFFRVEEGSAKVVMNGEESLIGPDEVAIVPSGVEHNVINVGEGLLKLYTIYAPPEHPDGTLHQSKPA